MDTDHRVKEPLCLIAPVMFLVFVRTHCSLLALVCLIGEPPNDPECVEQVYHSLTFPCLLPQPRAADTGLIEMSFFAGARRSC